MSWSIIDYNEYWAHAHDWEQVLFMSFAPEFIDTSEKYKSITWLNKWKHYWQYHKETHGNGCSNINTHHPKIKSKPEQQLN